MIIYEKERIILFKVIAKKIVDYHVQKFLIKYFISKSNYYLKFLIRTVIICNYLLHFKVQ